MGFLYTGGERDEDEDEEERIEREKKEAREAESKRLAHTIGKCVVCMAALAYVDDYTDKGAPPVIRPTLHPYCDAIRELQKHNDKIALRLQNIETFITLEKRAAIERQRTRKERITKMLHTLRRTAALTAKDLVDRLVIERDE